MTSPSKRRDTDILKLMMKHEVSIGGDNNTTQFHVKLKGPASSPFEGGTWKVRVVLPTGYPYKSPSIGFCNTIYHPNIDFRSGTVCLDVINQTWSPMFDLVNIFDVFLPQLLLYPNPTDPLNGEAGSLLLESKESYIEKVKECVQKYASEDIQVDSDDEDSDDENDTNQTERKCKVADEKKTKSDDGDDSDFEMSDEEEFSDMDDMPEEAADLEL